MLKKKPCGITIIHAVRPPSEEHRPFEWSHFPLVGRSIPGGATVACVSYTRSILWQWLQEHHLNIGYCQLAWWDIWMTGMRLLLQISKGSWEHTAQNTILFPWSFLYLGMPIICIVHRTSKFMMDILTRWPKLHMTRSMFSLDHSYIQIYQFPIKFMTKYTYKCSTSTLTKHQQNIWAQNKILDWYSTIITSLVQFG